MTFDLLFRKICNRLRCLVDLITHFSKRHILRETNPQMTADYIYNALTSDKPCMIARYGSVELYCLTNYMGVKKGRANFIRYILGKSEAWWWIPQRLYELQNNAGFFSLKDSLIEQYCELILTDTQELDILASWINKEILIEQNLEHCIKVFLPHLEPYYAREPWTRALEGKEVLVVHPFANIIKQQYEENRTKLFIDPQILPLFDLKVLPAIQSIGGESNGFTTWFDALDYMKTEIDKINYDICIIGCGAYGFHLAAHVKRMGKKAIHMGGATQLLFGIKGNRWEDPMYGVKEWGIPYGFYTDMFNDYWRKPGIEERPKKADSVEGACYW